MLAVLCLQYKLFDPHLFIVITIVVLVTFFLFWAYGSNAGALSKSLAFMDKRALHLRKVEMSLRWKIMWY